MIKVILVFIVGFIEQLLYTAYLLSVNKKQVKASTLLMVAYMTIYLFIITYAIKDTNTIPLLIAYALACGAGNYCIMLWENRNKKEKKNVKKTR
jgi:multidrug transporter EmrE-like cation transporter